MFKKTKYVMVFFISISIVIIGFIRVSNVLPDFIKDRSNFKVNYSSKPFDLEIDAGDYIVYFNNKAVENYKKNTSSFLKNIVSNNPVKKILNKQ